MKLSRAIGALAAALGLMFAFHACVSDDGSVVVNNSQDGAADANCPLGNEGCACTSGNSCNPGLSCESDLCVRVDQTEGGATDGGGAKDAGDQSVDACALGACSPEVVVGSGTGLATIDHLEARSGVLYGTSSGGTGDAGQVWRASTTPNTGFAYLTQPLSSDMHGTGALALDSTFAYFGNVGGNSRGVWKTALSGDGGASLVTSTSVPVSLAVDATWTYAADGTSVGITRDSIAGLGAGTTASCTNTGAAVVTDIVTDANGSVYWAGSELGRASASQIATWTSGNACETSPITGITVAGLGADATNLYVSDVTNAKIKRMPLLACTPTTCQAAGKTCGAIPNGCGSLLDCGTCGVPMTCGGGGANLCGNTACTAKTCGTLPAGTCGIVSDGCAGVLDCGGCAAPSWCGGGGIPNTCGGTLQDLTSQVTVPTTGTDAPKHLVSDGTKVYWGGGGHIWAIKADGTSSSLQSILIAQGMNVGALALGDTHVYFTDDASHQVYRVPK